MTEATDMRPLFSPKTLAAYLGVSERVARGLIGGPNPKIASFLIGGGKLRRIDPAEVDRYVAACQAQPTEGE
jgi:hypothetical protein